MPYAICDRCGFRFDLEDLRKEWTGLMVCDKDWDPKPPQTKAPRVRPEGLPRRNARPDPEPVFAPLNRPFDPDSL